MNKANKIIKVLPSKKTSVNFDKDRTNDTNNIKNILSQFEKKCLLEFEAGFIILPFFETDYIFNKDNFSKIKNAVKDTVNNVQDRWVLHKVASEQKIEFYNFSVDEIGYKAGKKGSKDKPNELLSVFDINNKKIFNIKYSNSWEKIDETDSNTVLGKIKTLDIWQ